MVSKKLAVGLCALLAASELVSGSAKPSVASKSVPAVASASRPLAAASSGASASAVLDTRANNAQAISNVKPESEVKPEAKGPVKIETSDNAEIRPETRDSAQSRAIKAAKADTKDTKDTKGKPKADTALHSKLDTKLDTADTADAKDAKTNAKADTKPDTKVDKVDTKVDKTNTKPEKTETVREAKADASLDKAKADDVKYGSANVADDKLNLASNFSPKDTVFDPHRSDEDDKFHAPVVAPNDKQPDTADPKREKKIVEEATAEDSRKNSKGSVILDDYDPSRLGVSADEAKSPKAVAKGKDQKGDPKGDQKLEKPGDQKPEVARTSKLSGEAKESAAANAVADNKATNAKQKAKEEEAETAKDVEQLDKESERDAKQRKLDAEKSEATSSASSSSSHAGSTSAIEEAAGCQLGRLVGSATMIVVSEIGDKTFFIAALMAMRHPPLFVFSSSYAAMVIMTVLSMILGLLLPSLLSRRVTTLLAALLFLVFGARLVKEAWGMDKSLAATDELEEVEHDLSLVDSTSAAEKAEAGGVSGAYTDESRRRSVVKGLNNLARLVFSPVWIQIFAMTFLGEWGDRSQIATVAMGAGEGWMQTLVGCLLGHCITTAMAVLGGKILANHLSLRTITFSGALCFLLFAGIYFHDWLHQ